MSQWKMENVYSARSIIDKINNGNDNSAVLALPLALTTIEESLTSTDTMQLDYLGPIIVNTDETMQRIPNWSSMSRRVHECSTPY